MVAPFEVTVPPLRSGAKIETLAYILQPFYTYFFVKRRKALEDCKIFLLTNFYKPRHSFL